MAEVKHDPAAADTTAVPVTAAEPTVKGEDTADSGVPSEPTKTEDTANGSKEQEATKETKPTTDTARYSKDDPLNKYRTKGNKGRGSLFDPSVQSKTDDPVEIRKQVEFYFSEHNLCRDKFLFEKIGGTANTAIPIKTLHSFKRMRRFEPYEAVVKALRESTELEVTDDEEVKRSTPLSEEFESKTFEQVTEVMENKSMARSVYVKGFGLEKPSTQFDLEDWFSSFGPWYGVRLRRADDHSFKGSVFVEFKKEETAKAFLEQDPAPVFEGRELRVLSKKAYCDEKRQQILDGKIQPSASFDKTRARKHKDDRNWNERRDEDKKNGFRDNGRGRGRGRGRGGRGGHRSKDGDYNNPRNGRKDDADGERNSESKEKELENLKKRSREEDGGAHEPEAKKEKVSTE